MRFAADRCPLGAASPNRSSEDVYTAVLIASARQGPRNRFLSLHFQPEISLRRPLRSKIVSTRDNRATLQSFCLATRKLPVWKITFPLRSQFLFADAWNFQTRAFHFRFRCDNLVTFHCKKIYLISLISRNEIHVKFKRTIIIHASLSNALNTL